MILQMLPPLPWLKADTRRKKGLNISIVVTFGVAAAVSYRDPISSARLPRL